MITESRQKRVLLIIITILLLANIATLIMFFVARPGKKKEGATSRKEKMNAYLKNELSYSDAQLNAYRTISEQHKKGVDSIFDNMRVEKESRLKKMSSEDFSDSSIERAAAKMAEYQKVLEMKMLRHIKDVRSLGDEEQKLKFDTGFLHYMNRSKTWNKN